MPLFSVRHVLGLHINFIAVRNPHDPLVLAQNIAVSFLPSLFLSPADQARHKPFFEVFTELLKEMGYAHIQATKPDTVGESTYFIYRTISLKGIFSMLLSLADNAAYAVYIFTRHGSFD